MTRANSLILLDGPLFVDLWLRHLILLPGTEQCLELLRLRFVNIGEALKRAVRIDLQAALLLHIFQHHVVHVVAGQSLHHVCVRLLNAIVELLICVLILNHGRRHLILLVWVLERSRTKHDATGRVVVHRLHLLLCVQLASTMRVLPLLVYVGGKIAHLGLIGSD